MRPGRCLLDVPVSRSASTARQSSWKNNELQPIITAPGAGAEVSESVVNFVGNHILIGQHFFSLMSWTDGLLRCIYFCFSKVIAAVY